MNLRNPVVIEGEPILERTVLVMGIVLNGRSRPDVLLADLMARPLLVSGRFTHGDLLQTIH
jgi:hypothetical protein